jgi:hypothetical protein
MKKYKVSIDGGPEQIVFASSGDLAALRCRLRDAFNQKLKTGESQKVTVTVTRLPYTKADDEARRGLRQPLPKRQACELKVGDFVRTEEGFRAQVTEVIGDDAQIRLVPEVGDVYVTDSGEVYGTVTGLNDDGTCRIQVTADKPLPAGTQIYNPALGGRQAKYDARVIKEQQQSSVSSELAALGL